MRTAAKSVWSSSGKRRLNRSNQLRFSWVNVCRLSIMELRRLLRLRIVRLPTRLYRS